MRRNICNIFLASCASSIINWCEEEKHSLSFLWSEKSNLLKMNHMDQEGHSLDSLDSYSCIFIIRGSMGRGGVPDSYSGMVVAPYGDFPRCNGM